MARLGFYDYDLAEVGTDGVIAKSAMTSLAVMPTGSEVGSPTYSSAGMTGAANAGYNITGSAALDVEGTFVFRMSADAWDVNIAPVGDENFLIFKAGQALFFTKNASNKYIKLTCSSVLNGKATGVDQWCKLDRNGWNVDGNGQIEVIITWDQGGVQVWVERLKCFDVLWEGTGTRPTFAQLILNSQGGSGGTYTYSNALVSTQKMVLPTTKEINNTVFLTDSYGQLGNYPQVDSAGRQALFNFSPSDEAAGLSYTEDGLNGVGFDGSVANYDSGMIPTCQRWLAKSNFFTHKIRWWGEGGSGIETTGTGSGDTMVERSVIMLNGNYASINVAVYVFGYNDAEQNTGAGPSDLGAYEALITAEFDKVIAANPNVKIIICTMPYNDNASFDPTLASVQGVNTAITNAADAYSQATLIDMYAGYGGATPDTSLFSGDNVHPSVAGQALYGKEIASAIVSIVY